MRLFLAASLAWAAAGCWTTRAVNRPLSEKETRAINAEVRDRAVTVVYDARIDGPLKKDSSGEVIEKASASGKEVRLEAAQISFLDEDGTKARRTVPVQALRELKYLSPEAPRMGGFFAGAGLGLLAGVAAGALIASQAYTPCPRSQYICIPSSASEAATFGAVGGGVLGIALGGITGAIVGHKTIVELRDDPRPASPAAPEVR